MDSVSVHPCKMAIDKKPLNRYTGDLRSFSVRGAEGLINEI